MTTKRGSSRLQQQFLAIKNGAEIRVLTASKEADFWDKKAAKGTVKTCLAGKKMIVSLGDGTSYPPLATAWFADGSDAIRAWSAIRRGGRSK